METFLRPLSPSVRRPFAKTRRNVFWRCFCKNSSEMFIVVWHRYFYVRVNTSQLVDFASYERVLHPSANRHRAILVVWMTKIQRYFFVFFFQFKLNILFPFIFLARGIDAFLVLVIFLFFFSPIKSLFIILYIFDYFDFKLSRMCL